MTPEVTIAKRRGRPASPSPEQLDLAEKGIEWMDPQTYGSRPKAPEIPLITVTSGYVSFNKFAATEGFVPGATISLGFRNDRLYIRLGGDYTLTNADKINTLAYLRKYRVCAHLIAQGYKGKYKLFRVAQGLYMVVPLISKGVTGQ